MKVYSVADNIISPLGFTTSLNFNSLKSSISGIAQVNNDKLYPETFFGAHIGNEKIDAHFDFEDPKKYTSLEKLFILSIKDILQTVPGIDKERLLLIVSTTKGNIDLLNTISKHVPRDRIKLSEMANTLAQYFHMPNKPLVISNACISGVSALLVGKKMIDSGLYDHVLVTGGDVLSEFTISGFQSLMAISDKPCRPYDASRNGISLGEACGTMLLSKDPGLCSTPSSFSVIKGGGQSNDANHISGPSRTGKGLKIAIEKSLKNSGLEKRSIDYINAHGTATQYNDEMESIAFHNLGLDATPLNSLKGFFGHTLGAAGVLETIMSIWQMNQGLLIKSEGYKQEGTSNPLNILKENTPSSIKYALKTASGFGGCNAAIILEKNDSRNSSI
ncbi:MAG: beta-ketoacyl synthase N-terminal-like domain-containing protein [Cytophagaceae bacterium]